VACASVIGLCIVLMSPFRPPTRAARGRVDARDAGGLVPGSFLARCWTESECFEMDFVRMSDNGACDF